MDGKGHHKLNTPFRKFAQNKTHIRSLEFIAGSVGGFFHFILKTPLNKTENIQNLISEDICENLY